jgi:alpha-galactosidase
VVPYADADPQVVLNGAVNDFVRKHLGIRLAQLHQKPSFVYNTWTPFRTDINEALILDLARSAAAMGFQEFIIDDGWQANRSTLPNEHPIGDWLINKERFPHGLKPVFDEIKRLGMKPGLWLSLGAASNDSAVLAEHPEWFVRDAAGRPANLHGQHGHNRTRVTACLATGWADHFKHIVLKLVREHGLEYVKLDLALVTSAYLNDPLRSGCHATDHPGHRDHAESYYAIYAALWRLFDELHAEAPDLFIDCTFEAMGKLQLIDYAMCQHAEGNWLSNFEERAPLGSWRVRQMAWWRSPAMPATALVIGNQQLDDPEWEHSLKSLLGVFPIFLGDPRLVPAAQQQRIRQWADWQGAAQRKYDFSSYRRDPPGFGEPALGAWDGFMRVNTDTGAGGVVAVFRENARETTRRVFVPDLTPTREYAVKLAPEGRVLHTLTGRQLAEEGFPVTLERASDGAVFEIERR